MIETILSILFPPSLGKLEVYQDFSRNEIDPFAELNGMDGVVAVRPKQYRDAIERVRAEGI